MSSGSFALLVLLQAAGGLEPSGIAVVANRSATTCSLAERTTAALTELMPSLSIKAVEREAPPRYWRLDYDAGERPARLTLRDEADRQVLSREIDLAPADCAALADSAAFIVERHLRDLGYLPPIVSLPDANNQEGADNVAAATSTTASPPPGPTETATTAATQTATTASPSRPSAWVIHVGATGEWPAAADVRLGGQLGISLRPGALEVGLSVLLLPAQGPEVFRRGVAIGRFRTSTLLTLLGLGGCIGETAVGCAQVLGGLEAVQGQTTGDRIFQSVARYALAGVIGAESRLELWPAADANFGFGVGLAGLFRPNPVQFQVDGADAGSEYVDPSVALFLSLRLLMRFF